VFAQALGIFEIRAFSKRFFKIKAEGESVNAWDNLSHLKGMYLSLTVFRHQGREGY
jgi:hypothetical protein